LIGLVGAGFIPARLVGLSEDWRQIKKESAESQEWMVPLGVMECWSNGYEIDPVISANFSLLHHSITPVAFMRLCPGNHI
jgi:hypothetical protein